MAWIFGEKKFGQYTYEHWFDDEYAEIKMEIIIVAAMAENRVIGKDNAIPWSLKEDMVHFKKLTGGWPCIMGRKTWESLPKRPLPGRLNIVITHGNSHLFSGAAVLPSLQEAVQHCAGYKKIFICGGASIYREALEIADKIELTVIHKQYKGDVFFPEIDPSCWVKTNTVDFDGFSFVSFERTCDVKH